MKIEVILRNRSPLSSAAPGQKTISIDNVLNVPNGFPLTAMRTMAIPVDGQDKPAFVPVIPGNSIRNVLRRSMLSLVLDQVRGKATMSIGAYAAACSGNASGNPEGVPPLFDELLSVRNHVFLGLFGGGPRMIRGRLSVDTLYPLHASAQRVLGAGYEDRYVAGRLTQYIWMNRKDPITRIASEEESSVITDGRAEITSWALNQINSSIRGAEKRKTKTAKSDKASDDAGVDAATAAKEDRGLNTLNAHEVTLPGIDWLLSIRIEKPTPAQVGLVLKGIEGLNSMTIGGGHSKGYGVVEVQEVQLKVGSVSTNVWDGIGYSEDVTGYFDELTEALDKIDVNDFESFVKRTKEAAGE
ncbi:type IV CRISPR-associated protein Csf2 [Pseudomonas sp. MWU12-2323]|uniref:type IV CRISPR-associated protein Csf2 n=1 Tax=Pseudomonas sp. MWU12-2323 TaxID=2651296 RepID=UPI00128B1902|nr:type IV CRISPR-associated protein Csf2 [Pseudomonas sp. MWU12-2323]MPQ69348.1 type IV CRISPR-associated protein Csf2 [Pseudomonas sp. MWU12-2323]